MLIFIGAMFELGFLGTSLSFQPACRAASGYLCQDVGLASSGKFGLTIGQASSEIMYHVGLACAEKSTLVGEPLANGNAFMYVANNGTMVNEPTDFLLPLGGVVSIHNLTCFDASGNVLTSNIPAGKSFSEVLWMNWTQQSGSPSASNPWLTTKFASVQIKAP